MLAGVAVILAVVLGGGALLAKNLLAPRDAGGVTPGGPGPSQDTMAFSQGRPSTGGAGNATQTVDVGFQLDQLEDSTNPRKGADSARAVRVLKAIDEIKPRIANPSDLVHAKLLEAEALLLVKRHDDACELLKDIEGKAENTRRTRVKALLLTC